MSGNSPAPRRGNIALQIDLIGVPQSMSIGHPVAAHRRLLAPRPVAVPLLLPGCLAILGDDPGGDPAAVLDLDPLALGPFTDFRAVNVTAGGSAARPARPPRSCPGDLPAGRDEPGQRAPQLRRVRRAQINLIASPVQPEPQRRGGRGRLPGGQRVGRALRRWPGWRPGGRPPWPAVGGDGACPAGSFVGLPCQQPPPGVQWQE